MSVAAAAGVDVTYTRESFIARFGSLVEWEKDVITGTETKLSEEAINATGQSLDAKYRQLKELAKTEKTDQELADIANNLFKIKKPISDPSKLSFSERYDFFRGEPFQDMNGIWSKAGSKLLFYKGKVGRYQHYEQLGPDYPLQDLSDYARRVSALYKWYTAHVTIVEAIHERSNEEFFQKLSLLERLIFTVVSFVHSFFTYSVDYRAETKEFLADAVDEQRFLELKEATFNTTTITYQGQATEVTIAGALEIDEGASFSTRFIVYRAGTEEILGEIDLPQQEPNSDQLVISHFFSKDSGLDIDRVLTQIALEVLQREPTKHILINTSEFSQTSYAQRLSLGWASVHNTSGKIEPTIQKIVKSDKPLHMPSLSPTCFAGQTRLYGLLPAHLRLDGQYHAWEEVIASNPLLGPGTGPVLPTGNPFFTI